MGYPGGPGRHCSPLTYVAAALHLDRAAVPRGKFEFELVEKSVAGQSPHSLGPTCGLEPLNGSSIALGGRSKPANDGRLKTGQRN